MNRFTKVVIGFGLPLLAFLVLKDSVYVFQKNLTSEELAYVVVEPEEPKVEEEVEVAEEEPVVEEPEAEIAEEPAEVVADAEVETDADVAAEAEAAAEEDVVAEPDVVVEADEATEEDATVSPDAEAVAEAEVETTTETSAGITLTAAELEDADRQMRKCKACHQLERERNGVGPHLVGVVGRTVGAVDGYRYSDALMELNAEGEVWTEEAILEWLINPAAFAKGTKMNFKVGSEDDRRLIAGWLAANPAE